MAHGCARRVEDVVTEVGRAERTARTGHWVALAIAYEAAPAFDATLQVVEVPPGTPLLWWVGYRDRTDCAPPSAPCGGASPVADIDEGALEGFPSAVARVRSMIEAGLTYQVNLTVPITGRITGGADALYRHVATKQRSGWCALLQFPGQTFVSASPELFLRWDDDVITTRPMKGTAQRHVDPAMDARAATTLRTSAKELAENLMIVDLLRNDLSRVAVTGSVRVEKLFEVEQYPTVWQLTSTITARTPSDTGLVDVLTALFPSGSVTGAPKGSAMAAISQLETEPRGIYCGALGYLSPPGAGARVCLSVPIRTAIVGGDQLRYGAGAGITWASDPDSEREEVRLKCTVLHRSASTSVFETLRQDGDGVHNIDPHLDRMGRAADCFDLQWERALGLQQLVSLPPVAVAHRVRLTLHSDGSLQLATAELDTSSEPVSLVVDAHLHDHDSAHHQHKSTRRDCIDEAAERYPEADEVIMLNLRGEPMETNRSNLLWRRGVDWFTPSENQGGLPGIGQQLLLESGSVKRFLTTVDDLESADELAVVNDLRGWRRALLAEPLNH